MGKSTSTDVLDAALAEISSNATLMTLCTQEPTNRAEATNTFALADVAMAPSDFTLADGISSGRRITVGAKTTVATTAAGQGTHVALVDATRLLHVTTSNPADVTFPGTVDFPAWDIEMRDPL